MYHHDLFTRLSTEVRQTTSFVIVSNFRTCRLSKYSPGKVRQNPNSGLVELCACRMFVRVEQQYVYQG